MRGADPSSKIGEAHEPENIIIQQINSAIKEEQLKYLGMILTLTTAHQ